MPTFRPSLSASSVLQRALFKPLGAAMFALCATVSATQAHAADLPVLKVGDQSLQTRGIPEASGQLKDLPYKIEWFNV
ncbi:aliphatic sulfonates ABC transporter substrate-binding protein, partial [Pseudomonas sp. MDMC224]